MKKIKPKVVVITGASSGIGSALAQSFLQSGASVVLLARRIDRLLEIAKPWQAVGRKVLCLACDVTKPQDLTKAVQQYQQVLGPSDLVIANAGFGVVGNVEKLTAQDYQRQFDTNIFGVLNTLWATLDDLKATGGGFGVVGSVNGYAALPGNSAYAMSKFAVRALCVSLRGELAPYGIAVTHIAPGFVQSEIRRVDNQGNHHPGARDIVPLWLQMPAQTAANQIQKALIRRKPEVVITLHGKIVVWWVRFFPKCFATTLRWLGIHARPEKA